MSISAIIGFITSYWWVIAILIGAAYVYRWWKNRKGGGSF
jgi:hypothetical protein